MFLNREDDFAAYITLNNRLLILINSRLRVVRLRQGHKMSDF